MFNCEKCGLTTAPGIPQKKFAAARRVKSYPVRQRANRSDAPDNGGLGTETVREIAVCPKCALLLEQNGGARNDRRGAN